MKTVKLVTIKDVLKIEVEKRGKRFYADAKILSGSPPIGSGQTEYEALYDLLAKLMFQVGSRLERGHCDQWTMAISKSWKEL